jgi:hypothetical protein
MMESKSKARAVKSFREAQVREAAYESRDRGMQTVPLKRIVGSVSRYKDFDTRFRLKEHLPQERLRFIRKAMQEGRPLVPVELYQVKDEYFVVDGNHRISVAKELGYRELEAHVVELLPSPETPENTLYREKRSFQEQTGLAEAIELTELGQYGVLFDQIRGHQGFLGEEEGAPVPLPRAAEDWRRSIFAPLVSILEANELPRRFPGRTAADLYTYISSHQWGRRHERSYGFGIDQILGSDMEEFRKNMANRKETDYPEMLREMTVFILMNISARHETKIIDRLFSIDEIREVHSVHGNIDIIVKAVLTRDLLSSDAEVVSRFVQQRIRRIPGILSTQTLIPGISKVKN